MENLGQILHNKRNPYMISIICDECRKDPKKREQAEATRFDIRKVPKIHGIDIKNLSNKQIVKYIEDYLSSILTIGEFCTKNNMSRYQFNLLLAKYDSFYPEKQIYMKFKNHSNTIHREIVRKIKAEYNLVNYKKK